METWTDKSNGPINGRGSLHGDDFKNTLLRALGSEIIARLHLRPVIFELEHQIEYPGDPIDHIFFLETGMASRL